jgi:peptide-methionine (S)-S-oxide reductase
MPPYLGMSFCSMIREVSDILRIVRIAVLVAITILAGAAAATPADAGENGTFPDPVADAPLTTKSSKQTAVVGGGCFWGVQLVFQHVKGVKNVTSGYAGGTVASPQYEEVGTGKTGHAESVKITFDSSQISYGQLLKVFFSVAHDPTQLNRQGPDFGSQYRSVIFYDDEEQKRIAEAYIAQLELAKAFSRPIVTQVVPLQKFYAAEIYHQNYATLHPDDHYILVNDAPKLELLRQEFPALYKK